MSTAETDAFNIELLKLLLQVAWGDGVLDPSEAQMFFGLGRSWNVPEAELTALRGKLEAGKGLPAPNLAVLRQRRDDVMVAIRAFANTDGYVGPDETQLIDEVTELLG
ncbi:MAG: TerB family tellurite resistance protein [Myxococcaceae bacterium]